MQIHNIFTIRTDTARSAAERRADKKDAPENEHKTARIRERIRQRSTE